MLLGYTLLGSVRGRLPRADFSAKGSYANLREPSRCYRCLRERLCTLVFLSGGRQEDEAKATEELAEDIDKE